MNRIAILILLALGCWGCKKDPAPIIEMPDLCYYENPIPCIARPAPIFKPGDMVFGKVSGFKNCIPFEASARAYFVTDLFTGIGLGINTYVQGSELWVKEILYIGAESDRIGTFSLFIPSLNDYAATYGTMQDIDVPEDNYRIDTYFEHNEITFTEIDTINHSVKGCFNVRFLTTQIPLHGGNPDTVSFTECHFEAHEF